MHQSTVMTMKTMQAYPANLKVGGTCQARIAGNLFGRALHFFGFTVVLASTSVWLVQFDHFLVFCSSYSRCPVPSHL